jgi:serine/threonine-protein kinase
MPELGMVVDRALAFDRERRYPSARTMQEDVRALLAGRPPPYAASRIAAGDLPNASSASSASAASTYVGASATAMRSQPTAAGGRDQGLALAMTVHGPVAAHGYNPSSQAASLPYTGTGVAMMQGTGAAPAYAHPATGHGFGANFSGPSSVPSSATPLPMMSMPTSSHSSVHTPMPVTMSAKAAADRRAKDRWVALAAIGAIFVVLGIAIILWWSNRAPAGDEAHSPDGLSDEAPSTVGKSPRGKGQRGGKKGPRGSGTVIVIPLSPTGEPMPGRYGSDDEED